MTLEEIENELPNGFHDSIILESRMNYENSELTLLLDVSVGLPDEDPPARDRYRKCELFFKDVIYFVTEFPNDNIVIKHPGTLWILSIEKTSQDKIPDHILKVISSDVHCFSLYIHRSNTYVHFATKDVQYTWLD